MSRLKNTADVEAFLEVWNATTVAVEDSSGELFLLSTTSDDGRGFYVGIPMGDDEESADVNSDYLADDGDHPVWPLTVLGHDGEMNVNPVAILDRMRS